MARPLDGFRVLDLTQHIAGPFAGQMLADMGAEVIKVERPGTGENARLSAPIINGHSLYIAMYNRNKKAITLNLLSPGGQDIFKELVRKSHLVLENFRPGVMASFGFDYENLKKVKSDIILVSVSGFGQTGPYSLRPAYDPIIQAMAGYMEITGYPDRPPVKTGAAAADFITGLYASIGALLALMHHQRTGEGQMVDVAMLDAVASTLEFFIPNYLMTGEVKTRTANLNPLNAPSNSFKAKDGYVYAHASTDEQWQHLVAAIGRPELADEPCFKTRADRRKHRDETNAVVDEWASRHTVAEVVAAMDKAGVPCGPVNTIPQVAEDPQLRSREMIREVEYGALGKVPVMGPVVRLSRTPAQIVSGPPLLGQDNKDVYCGLLGHSEDDLDRWKAQGII